MSIEVRIVSSAEDYEKCLLIRRKVFIEGMDVPEEHEIDAYEEEATHFLALYEDMPAATGRIRIKKGFVKFERIATLSEFRGKGLASALMEAMQEEALEHYSAYLPAMHAQVSAISFYLKLGWVAVGDVFEEAGIDHQVMVLLPQDISKLKCLSDPETPKAILDYLKSQ
ncbi:GNAT family N-acetyltransferase [Simkania sp.]|uniref:GNAT family N-acetyltransferase n=1 Tax=Simkania sp. TaxID=34094 RepID=UPI003B51DEC3